MQKAEQDISSGQLDGCLIKKADALFDLVQAIRFCSPCIPDDLWKVSVCDKPNSLLLE